MEKMFEIAVRNKFRFPFKGAISVEDLWDLDLRSLDNVFRILNNDMKKVREESLIADKTVKNECEDQLAIKIEIVKHIFTTKKSEAEAAEKAKERAIKKQRIMELIYDKQEEELHGKSVEELQAMLDEI